MDTLILGLLILKSRTIYEIKNKIDNGMNLMYSGSFGSIQSAVKKLLANNYIVFSEIVENGKYKKVYTITDKGREYFHSWINTPMSAGQSKNPDLPKLYFMGISDKGTRADRIQEYIDDLNNIYNKLNFIYYQGCEIKAENDMKDILNYQLLSVKYGVDMIHFEIEWYKKLLYKIKKGEI